MAGGGSKAAPFGMGVIKSLIDNDNLKKIDIISTVSGGSYSALYLYHKALYLNRKEKKLDNLSDFYKLSELYYDKNLSFDERIKYAGIDYSKNITPNKSCRKISNKIGEFQKWVGCNQDILDSTFSYVTRKEEGPKLFRWPYKLLPHIAGVGLSFVPHHFANTLFDWKLELSPSQESYFHGISRAYGFVPTETKTTKNLDQYNKKDFKVKYTFKDLEELLEDHAGQLPMWIINTTNETNYALMSFNDEPTNLDKGIFEITPYGYGSGLHGYKIGNASKEKEMDLSITDSVEASAAFFDSSSYYDIKPIRTVAFSLLHLFNMRWGVLRENHNVSDSTRTLHKFLPIGLYHLHSLFEKEPMYIRLSDGGMSENLGLYSLIKRGTRNIIVVSEAHDSKELKLDDICKVNSFLDKNGYSIVFKGNPENEVKKNNNYNYNLSSECEDGELVKKINYKEWNDKFNIWEGMIFAKDRVGEKFINKNNAIEGIKLHFIKASIDEKKFMSKDNKIPLKLVKFWKDIGSKGDFPQDKTAFITFDSSRSLYEAYLNLGYYKASKLEIK